ncbi:MAG: endonuclease III [Bacteroidetes bacterium]|nr:endonuclease III [Bacteroidota bacterium]
MPYEISGDRPEILDVLIATKLSQNTTDKSSFRAFTNLKEKYGSWEKTADADLRSIRNAIKVCGLADTKAKEIKSLLKNLRKKFGSLDLEFMHDYSNGKIYGEFLSHKGFGVKTVSCVLIFAMGRDAFPVDTHVHRTLNRLGIVRTSSAEKTYESVKDIIPKGKKYELHSNLIKFGRNICKAKNPLCGVCFLYRQCRFEDKIKFREKDTPADTTENNFIILENI